MAERKKDPLRVQLKAVRLSYAALYKAKAYGGGNGDGASEPKFQANFIIDPETKVGQRNIQLMEDAIDHAIENQKWSGGKTPKFPEAKLPLRDGENVDSDGYDGMMFVSASNAKKPRVLDRDKMDVQEGDDEAPYSGCIVDAIVRVWAQDNKYGKRINASLEGVRFREDGDAFGAAPLDPDEFDDDDDDDGGRGSSRGGRSRRGRDDEREERGSSRRSRSRDDDDDSGEREERRGGRRSRGDDDDEREERGSSRRGRSRDDDDDGEREERRGGRRSRDDDEEREERGSSRRSRSRDDDDDREERRGRRSRNDDEREERSSRSRRSRDDDDLA